MQNYISVFKQNISINNYDMLVKGALECLDRFGECFEKEDLHGMDFCLHFPHYIISGNEVICWDEPGQLPNTFFSDFYI